MTTPFRFLLITLWLATGLALAEPLKQDQIPAPLKPWVDWVLKDHQNLDCPFLYNNYEQKRCSWPSQLSLSLTPKGANFKAGWQVDNESWIVLPGDNLHWPQGVTVDQKPALVTLRDNRPMIKLTAGYYEVAGHFLWDNIPETLRIPDDTGLISLIINDKSVASPLIKQGQLWLKGSENGVKKPESLQDNQTLQVFRQWIDEVPTQMVTHIDIDVTGTARELKLNTPLLEGFVPFQMDSSLPARLEPDGTLLIQARPGRWGMDIWTRRSEAAKPVVFSPNDPIWPQSEIWVFNARPALRVVEIESLTAIDPSQTNLPPAWKQLPAYSITAGQSFSFKIIRRGDAEQQPNQLSLTRKLWLDFDGRGYTVNDRITGMLSRGWRLDAQPGIQLGKVSLDGQNQLITVNKTNAKEGVEVRKGSIVLDADSRITDHISTIKAVGWDQGFSQVSAELNLPPGWRLIAAGGVDNAPDSWLSRWTLLDLFLVLIAALATAKLWNYSWGALALVTLILIWHEPGAPQWVWLNILASIALIRVLPEGKFLTLVKGARNALGLYLVVVTIPFMIAQVRMGLYPQLELPWQTIQVQDYAAGGSPSMEASEALSDMAIAPTPPSAPQSKMRSLSNGTKGTYYATPNQNLAQTDPNARIQTGPGLPQWQWRKVHLSWNGWVDSQQAISLWYLSPAMSMLLNFIRVILIVLLGLLLFGFNLNLKLFKTRLPGLAGLMLLPLLSLPSQDSFADFPDPALLEELKNRMLEAPDCLPGCAQISHMQLTLTAQNLNIELEIHATQAVSLPLPAQNEQWFPNQVLVDGKPATSLFSTDNNLWLGLTKGRHFVTMSGVAPVLSKFILPLSLNPNYTEISLSGWEVNGLHENGSTDSQLQFTRVQQLNGITKTATLEPGVLPPFVKVERFLTLGLDWRITTQVIRMSPPGTAIVLALPLINGEAVTTAGIRVNDKTVQVNMTADQMVLRWDSVLEKADAIQLTAADTQDWIEVWRADISPIWHIETSGIAMMHIDKQGYWQPEWHPWPGEKLEIQVTRPEAIKGQTVTIESSRLSTQPGQRSRQVDLQLTINSSLGTQHTLKLPLDVELESVIIQGSSQPVRAKDGLVTLPLSPGKQSISLRWQEPESLSFRMDTSKVDLGLPSVNADLQVTLGQDRWILYTLGPKFGPAVLLWGVLIVLAGLAMGLGKIALTPIKHWQWLLLLIGLSQVSILSGLIVVLWLIALGAKAQYPESSSRFFNALQVGLGALTLISLSILFIAVEQGLLGAPDMQIIGNQSSAYSLKWYQDRSDAQLPIATVFSVPLIVYRILMLAWSLWLAVSLLNWLKWGWNCFSKGGVWKKAPVKPKLMSESEPTASTAENERE
ncbi:hypothetical protein [Methylicorpusculum sp.]|uniref:hypothetical protein n=1 Tax=Methylicorpusculum sp. TaxID=2713644 RepID=UPI00272FCE0F|nr:hypothetical protein [Methylicorpusculum sp.]MDP2177319.1 hypothetical protein [Methylicorpusculum sp.]MDP3531034.1 hypothetical protein [Methylicorpusculum sp.]MDZ4153788.1 hypothetical protein [Methylicorpusculum sp.]